MLSAARRAPDEVVLGLDADATRMREASHRAARPRAKGGLPNAWFAVAAAEALPGALDGRVDETRVTLPWGSLLRGALGPETWFLEAIGRISRPDGSLRMLLSVTPRDGVGDIRSLDGPALPGLARRYREAGWVVLDARDATPDDVTRSGSSWAKRLGIPNRRPAAVLQLLPPSGSSTEPAQASRRRRSTCAPPRS
ncbi:MAG: hypothetical protein ABWZ82_07110 [Candidatus Limnocylindrales bacterium]